MAELSETACELIDIMKERGLEKDDVVSNILFLSNEENHKIMLAWIKENPTAGSEEICGKMQNMMYGI